jgi:hypothetical protein
MAPRTCYSPSKSYANCPAYPSLGQKRFNAALNLLNSHLSQHSLRNRCQVLYSNCTSGIEVYTPSGAPHHHWRPHISHVPKVLRRGHSYRLRGRQLNGLSQANGYGDDAQMASNYPLVRLRHANKVHFCRTYHHSTMAVATGKKLTHTHFHVPNSVPPGHYELVVIATGIHSQPVKVHVKP